MWSNSRVDAELRHLRELSARIGRDAEQVQAGGGNTSIKLGGKSGGILWVKASGFWLADALDDDIFVPVALEPLRRDFAAGLADPVGPNVIAELNPRALRPSIETSLHALMPQRIVVHTHSVRTIAHAVRSDMDELLRERLSGLSWSSIPYVHPGVPLTRAMVDAVGGRDVDVVVMGNHGLVVGGEDWERIERLLREVERRLDLPVASFSRAPAGPQTVAEVPKGWRRARHAQAHFTALDPLARRRAATGSLYPDHVIFLGPAASHERPGQGSASKLWLHDQAGALLPEDAGRSADELALCLALVLARIPPEAELTFLRGRDEAALLNWDAESYRQSVAKA